MKNSRFLFPIFIGIYLSGCATLPTNFERPVSRAFTDTENTMLGRYVRRQSEEHPDLSGFHLLENGLNAFVARVALADSAERSIDLQYYLYHNDLVGHLLTYYLLKAADRGVRVRLLIDDMGMSGRDLGMAAMDAHPNIEVRIFNPFSRNTGRNMQYITRVGSVTRRMHNKSFTVDNQVSILGGRNIGDEYFDANPALAFSDLDVLTIGPVVRDVSGVFDRFWNSELAYPATVLRGKTPTPGETKQLRQDLDTYVEQKSNSDYLQALRDSDLAKALQNESVTFEWGDAVIVSDQPEKLLHDTSDTQYHLAPQIAHFFNETKSELIIISPYFVPGKSGTAFLIDQAKRGVRVRILTNSLASNDVAIVHAGYSKYRKTLLRGGIELYEMNKKLTRQQRKEKKDIVGSSKSSLHAKSFIFDRRKVFIGSLNLDPRALVHNTEIGVVMSSPEIGEEMANIFDRFVKHAAFRLELTKNGSGSEKILWHGQVDGKPGTFDSEPYTGFWKRFGIGLLRLLPIESQL